MKKPSYSNRNAWGSCIREIKTTNEKIKFFKEAANLYLDNSLDITTEQFAHALCAILEHFWRIGETKKGQAYFESYINEDLLEDPRLQRKQLQIYLMKDNLDCATEVFNQVITNPLAHLKTKSSACNDLLEYYCGHEYYLAQDFLSFIHQHHFGDSSTDVLTIKWFGKNDYSLARKAMHAIQKREGTHLDEKGLAQLSMGYSWMIEACSHHEQFQEALDFFEKAEKAKCVSPHVLSRMLKISKQAYFDARPELTPDYFFEQLKLSKTDLYHSASCLYHENVTKDLVFVPKKRNEALLQLSHRNESIRRLSVFGETFRSSLKLEEKYTEVLGRSPMKSA